MNILISYGTRPEYIKIKPLLDELRGKIDFKLLFTGQHEHLCDFPWDYSVPVTSGENRLDSIVSSLLNLPAHMFEGITHTLVQGDTASAFSLALASFHRRVPVIHLEAGLRTWDIDNPYPEELYRQCISRVASIHFCATPENKLTLQDETGSENIFVVGNTVLDNLTSIQTSYGNDVIVTMHRRENHDRMDEWFKTISSIALENSHLNFILPLHPNPNVSKHKDLLKGINVVEPIDYDNFLELLSSCRLVISDSGGLQEECSFLQKKIIVCRKVTERTESVGTSSVLCEKPEKLQSIFNAIKDDYTLSTECPYGDGTASKKILKHLMEICKHDAS